MTGKSGGFFCFSGAGDGLSGRYACGICLFGVISCGPISGVLG